LLPPGVKSLEDLMEIRDHLGSTQDTWAIALRLYEEQNMRIDRVRVILNAIQELEQPDGLHILTTHAAKGLEYSRVLVHHDFAQYSADRNARPVSDEEWRLAYVAITRAQHGIKVPSYFPQVHHNSSML